MVQRCMTILAEAQHVWPLATRWLEGLEKFVHDSKGAVTGLEGSMADGVSHSVSPCVYMQPSVIWCFALGHTKILTQWQRDPVPHALQSSTSPTKTTPPDRVQNEQKPILPAEPKQQQQQHRRPSITPNANIAPAPPPPQQPMMYMDPQMRAPHPHSQSQTPQPQAIAAMPPPGHPQHPQHVGVRQTDGLGLLIEAFDTHQGGGMAGPAGQPYDPSMAGQHAEYYHHQGAGLPGNDGYENELQFYMDGAPNMQNWVGNGGMYGY